jgi:hypothetical protein
MTSRSINVAKEVATAVGDRPVMIPTPYVATHSVSTKPETPLHHADIFFDLTGNGPHYPKARSWSHYRTGRTVDPDMFFFQLLLLLCETTSEGMKEPKARPCEVSLRKKTVNLTARELMCDLPLSLRGELSKLVISTRKADFLFDYEVQNEVVRLQNQKKLPKQRTKYTSNRNKNREQEEENEEEELLQVPEEDEDATRHAPEPVSFDWFDNNDITKCTADVVIREMDKILNPAPAVASSSSSDERPPYTGPPHPLAKIDFTVTPIPFDGTTIERPENVCGMYVRFLFNDPTLNPGVFFNKLMGNLNQRINKVSQGNNNKSAWTDMFQNYVTLFHTSHPAGNYTNEQTYFHAAASINPNLQKDSDEGRSVKLGMDVISPKSEFHIFNLLTTKRAVDAMNRAGSARMLSTEWFFEKKVLYPLPTYKYQPEQVFWFNNTHIGLREQLFPNITLDTDFLSTLMAGGNIDASLGLIAQEDARAERNLKTTLSDLKDLLANNWMIERRKVLESNLVTYETNNEFIHRAAEAKVIYSAIAKEMPSHYSDTLDEVQHLVKLYNRNWRQHVPIELAPKIIQCERYGRILRKAQEGCMQTFTGLWQVESDVEDLSIPQSIKQILTWYRKNQSRLPNLTREYIMWDPALGLLGNSMLRQLKMYSCIARILQPIVCLLSEGLFSCYRYSPAELAFNMMLHGRYDVGKTYMAITTLLNYTCIEGTVVEFCVATGASDTTMKHNYDLIFACDEVMPFKVNNKEAERRPEQVNKEKIKMTKRQLGLNVFTNEKAPDGTPVRWARMITTDHHITLIEVTNHVVEAMNALASRYHRMTIAQPKMPAREMTGFMGEALKGGTITYLQINQFLSACGYKAAMVGATLPQPEMQLFHDLSNRVINYLVEQKSIDANTGSRGLEIMKPYAIQLIYHMAIHCAFDMPGSPNYKKKFEPSMIKEIEPFLYCTTEIVWWCWSSLACGWIDQNNANVIQAARKVAGIEYWGEAMSTYEMYERDVFNQIPWREHEAQNKDVAAQGDKKEVDLKYIQIAGNFESTCRKIAQHTNPRLDYTDVMGVLTVLSTTNITLPGGGMKPQPKHTFSWWHKYEDLPVGDSPGKKRLEGDKPGIEPAMPHDYRVVNSDKTKFRTEDDVPRTTASTSFSVVEIKADWVYIMPNVEKNYMASEIIFALAYATICKTTRPGKFLLGLPADDDPMRLQVFNCPRQRIDKMINDFDEGDGYKMDEDTKELIWTGLDIPEEERPVSRREGIAFNRRGGISKTDSIFFTAVPSAPVVDMEVWARQCNDDIEAMKDMREVAIDMDFESAKRQHIRCGRLAEPIMSPAWVEANYKKECAALDRIWTCNMHYPHENAIEMEERMAVWNATNPSQKRIDVAKRNFISEALEFDKPPTEALVARVRERERLREMRREEPVSKRDRIDREEVARLKAIEHNNAMEAARKKPKTATAAKNKKRATANKRTKIVEEDPN